MADENERHSVLIVGIDGISGGSAEAATRLEEKFRLPLAVAEKLVASIPAVVKKDVTMEEGCRYAAALRSIGADARVVPSSANNEETASVTGVLKPRRPRAGLSENRGGDVVPSSGGYMAINKKREVDESPPPFGPEGGFPLDEFSSFLDIEAEANPAVEPGAVGTDAVGTGKTMMGTGFAPSSFSLPDALNSGVPENDDGLPAAPVPPSGVSEPFDDLILGASSAHAFGAVSGELEAAETGFAPTEISDGNRPSLFDELMSMGDSGLGMSPGSGDFGLNESGEAAVRDEPVSKPSLSASSPELVLPTRSPSLSATGPTLVDQFGNLELAGEASGSSELALQLDTNKPHLTGSFAAVSDSGAFDTQDEGSGGLELAEPPDEAKGRTKRTGLNDPLEEEIERTLRESGASSSARGRAGSGAPRNVTGGFSAAAERNRNSNTRFARIIGWLILLIILLGGGAAGYVFYERWAAALEAKSFAEAPNYFEHTVRISATESGSENFVRGCAQPDPAVPTFSCRYSRDFYESHFPDVEPDLQAAAVSGCYGRLFDDGKTSGESLDCTVTVSRTEGNVSARLYASFRRECEVSLVRMESGDTTQCTLAQSLAVLAEGAAPPVGDRVPVEVEYKRPFGLDMDVGSLASREYLFTQEGRNAEYHYFAESIGLFVRSAELGGAAGLRLTFADRSGNTAGRQAWPR